MTVAPDILGDAASLLLIPKIVAYSLVLMFPTIGLVLVMSALARNARFAGLGFFLVYVGSGLAHLKAGDRAPPGSLNFDIDAHFAGRIFRRFFS